MADAITPGRVDLGAVSAYAVAVEHGFDGTEAEWEEYIANASNNAAAANTSKLAAEGYAVGKQNGVDVPSTSPYFENNSKYYMEQAKASVPADYTELIGDVEDLKSAITQVTGYRSIDFIENGSISIGSTIGAAISLTPNSSNNTDYIIQGCSSGDQFLLTGAGWHTERLWAFIDGSNMLISESNANETASNTTLVAPANAARLIVNAKRESEHYLYQIAASFPFESNGLKSAVNTINGLKIIDFTRDNTIVTDGATVDITKLSASNTGLCCAVTDCQAGDVFTISGTGASLARLWCFIDSSGNSLSAASAGATLTNGVVIAPANSAKIVINARNPFAVKGLLTSKRLVDLESETRFVSTNQNIISSTVTDICSGNANNIPNNNIYGINISSGAISNMPPFPEGTNGTYRGTFITFGKQSARGYGDVQIYVKRENGGSTYVRNYTTSWSTWSELADYSVISANISSLYSTVTDDINNAVAPVAADVATLTARAQFAPTGQNLISSTVASICSGDADNVPNNNIYGINIAYDSLSHMPFYPAGVNGTYQGTFITFGKEKSRGYGDVQIYIQRANNGGMYVRNYTSSWSAWKKIDSVLGTYVLGIGDSICEGWRNNNMGFAGMLGLPYRNLGVTGATLGQKTSHTQISDEIESQTITEDLIIANGGINDYYFDVPLGNMSTHPVVNDTQAEALDKSTVSGGLEYLLYLIIKKAPKAQRYFLITHKTRNYPYTQCAAGYTQQDLHDRIVAVCKLYNTKVIDVYEESVINSEFDVYISPTAYSNSNTSVTKQYYVDNDRIHPLWLGYQAGYLPVMLRTIQSAVMS